MWRSPREPPTVPEEGVALLYRTDRLEQRDSRVRRAVGWRLLWMLQPTVVLHCCGCWRPSWQTRPSFKELEDS